MLPKRLYCFAHSFSVCLRTCTQPTSRQLAGLVWGQRCELLPRRSADFRSSAFRTAVLYGGHRRASHTIGVTTMAAKQPQMDSTEVEAMLAKGKRIMEKLEDLYPEAPKGFLRHADPFTLLIAVVLSAQSRDVKVNEITPQLFRVGGTPEKMRALGEEKIRGIIKQIGLAPQKAKNIAKLSASICDEHGGKVPDTFEGLESLAGVGHKTASVVMMQAFNKPAFPVDTHIHRLACRWGCGDVKSVAKTEDKLKQWFPDPSTWRDLHVRIIMFGREYCPARNHDMDACPICSFAATDESRKNYAESDSDPPQPAGVRKRPRQATSAKKGDTLNASSGEAQPGTDEGAKRSSRRRRKRKLQ